jgi:hypothetical protein
VTFLDLQHHFASIFKMGCGCGKQNVLNGKVPARRKSEDTIPSGQQENIYMNVPSEEHGGIEAEKVNSIPPVQEVHASPGTSNLFQNAADLVEDSGDESIKIPDASIPFVDDVDISVQQEHKVSESVLYCIKEGIHYPMYSSVGDWQNVLRRIANMKEQTAYNHVATAPEIP